MRLTIGITPAPTFHTNFYHETTNLALPTLQTVHVNTASGRDASNSASGWGYRAR